MLKNFRALHALIRFSSSYNYYFTYNNILLNFFYHFRFLKVTGTGWTRCCTLWNFSCVNYTKKISGTSEANHKWVIQRRFRWWWTWRRYWNHREHGPGWCKTCKEVIHVFYFVLYSWLVLGVWNAICSVLYSHLLNMFSLFLNTNLKWFSSLCK